MVVPYAPLIPNPSLEATRSYVGRGDGDGGPGMMEGLVVAELWSYTSRKIVLLEVGVEAPYALLIIFVLHGLSICHNDQPR